jgi:DNA gyrase/topoisomerase IV subunit A
MEDSFFRYSMSVIIDRALPDVRDGLEAGPSPHPTLYECEW